MSLASKVLKAGVTRRVLLVGNLAIKFPRWYSWKNFLLGLLANMQEVKFSATGWPELCPVIFSLPGGFMVVMRRATEMTDDEFMARDMAYWIDRGNYVVPAEIKADSFGWLDGRLVAIDYGN